MLRQRFLVSASLALSLAAFVSITEAQQVRYAAPTVRYYYPAQHQAVYNRQGAVATQQPARQAYYTQPQAAQPQAAQQPQVAQTSAQQPVAQQPAAQQQQGWQFGSAIWQMLARNNAVRASRGMRPQILSSRLTAAAQNHANYMARTGSFSHYSNGGPQGRAAAYGFRGGVRENIAMGQPSVDSAFNVWTASGGHYANMMSHTDVAGFGYAVGANGQPYWVALYGNNDGGN